MSAEIRDKINLKILNLNHRFLFMVGRAFLTIGAVVALSCGTANAADVPGYACVLDPSPGGCTGLLIGVAGQRSTWGVTGCSGGGGLGVTSFSGESLCSFTAGTQDTPGRPAYNDGKYCWCRITSVNGGDMLGFWVLKYIHGDASNCAQDCRDHCGSDARRLVSVQRALFTGLGVTPAPVQPTNPTSCGNNTSNGPGAEGSWEVTGCSGSDVTSFTGFSRCSSTPGLMHAPGNPVADGGTHCWCKITSVKPNGAAAGSWFSKSGLGTADNCAQNCADQCGVYARQNNGLLRTELFSTLKTKGYACVSHYVVAGSNGDYISYGAAGQRGTWKIGGAPQSVSGESLCSSTSGTYSTPGDPSYDDGNNCWCRLTGFNPGGAVSSRWVFLSNNYPDASECAANHCSQGCATGLKYDAPLGSALFDAIGS
jgi:hypothetical protein